MTRVQPRVPALFGRSELPKSGFPVLHYCKGEGRNLTCSQAKQKALAVGRDIVAQNRKRADQLTLLAEPYAVKADVHGDGNQAPALAVENLPAVPPPSSLIPA